MYEDMDHKVPASRGSNETEAFVNLLMDRWRGIAAVAWDGFWTQGRGVVVITEADGDATLAYRSGHPCPCHQEIVEEYDPEHQVVIAHCATDGDMCCINVFGGWPAPPEAAMSATANECTRTLN